MAVLLASFTIYYIVLLHPALFQHCTEIILVIIIIISITINIVVIIIIIIKIMMRIIMMELCPEIHGNKIHTRYDGHHVVSQL